jgi:hypothetical protein
MVFLSTAFSTGGSEATLADQSAEGVIGCPVHVRHHVFVMLGGHKRASVSHGYNG